MTIHYTRRAEQALTEIAAYTLQQWGEQQCSDYLAALEHACEVLVPLHAKIARELPERPGLRYLRCERHLVFFRSVEDGFEIVHVLHERQLPKRHL